MKSKKQKVTKSDLDLIKQAIKKKRSAIKACVQKVTAYSFLGATAVNFINVQNVGTSLGLIAGLAFFVDVIILKK